MGAPDPAEHALGSALVAAQFALIGACALAGAQGVLAGRAAPGAGALFAAGLALAAWAVWCNRPGNFNIRPTPREGGVLIEHGPYRWIRHPMYTAVIACAVACAWVGALTWGWIAAAVLAVVLAVKARVEEGAMRRRYPEYAAYSARTRRFLPFVY